MNWILQRNLIAKKRIDRPSSSLSSSSFPQSWTLQPFTWNSIGYCWCVKHETLSDAKRLFIAHLKVKRWNWKLQSCALKDRHNTIKDNDHAPKIHPLLNFKTPKPILLLGRRSRSFWWKLFQTCHWQTLWQYWWWDDWIDEDQRECQLVWIDIVMIWMMIDKIETQIKTISTLLSFLN